MVFVIKENWKSFSRGRGVNLRIDWFCLFLLGLLGGMIWCTGTIANFAASSAPPEVNVGPAVSYALGQGATLISALWGLLVWKEFAGATRRVKTLIGVMLILFVLGLGLVSIAPLFGTY